MNDGGLIARLEQWMADTLKAITYGDDEKVVFTTADIWKHQVGAANGGGEAFARFQPFAVVGFQSGEAAREGGYDLRQVLEFAVFIGVESTTDGVARTGDATHLGISKIRDLVIEAFESKHPGSGFDCDEFYYTGEVTVFNAVRRHATEMYFTCGRMTPAD